jgi:DNA polymerase
LGREHKIGLYGGKLTENVVQALARIVMSDAMLRIDRELPVVMHVHDEIAVLAPESQAQETLDFMIAEMTKAPSWCPTIPLAAEGGYDQIYSK